MANFNLMGFGLIWSLFVMPSYSAGPMMDFDRTSVSVTNISDLFNEKEFYSVMPSAVDGLKTLVLREVLDGDGNWVEFKPIKTWVDVEGTLINQYTVLPNQAMRWTLRCSKGKWTAKLAYKLAPDQIGGHYHYDVQPPALFISSPSISASTAPLYAVSSPINFTEMKGNTTYYFWQTSPEFATRIVQQFDSYGACQGASQTDYINVEVRGLLEMPYGQNYVLDNPQDSLGYHPDNHYGMGKLINTLVDLSNQYKTMFPDAEPLHINDMSLPWGGAFDIGYNWKPPHSGHTIGADADINRALIPLQNRAKLLSVMCALTPGVALERDNNGDVPYYHMRVYGRDNSWDEGSGNTNRIVVCCKGNAVDPNNLQSCISDAVD